MKILFISNDLIAGHLAYLLKKEGHDVKLYIHEKGRRNNFDNLVKKTDNWRKELKWVGKDGLIVFDDSGYGKIQDKLRKQGYTVFGGCELGDKLENDREFGQEIFSKYGIKTVTLKDFENMDDAVVHAKENKNAWVIKQNNHAAKTMNYVSFFEDGRDAISVLKNYLVNNSINSERITLHQRIKGVEIGIGRYFNGKDWVGPIEYNVEHKKFFPGDIGTSTSEMGTLGWYSDDENCKLFRETLEKMKPFLQEIDFRGDFEVNCIINKDGIFPLEATPRFGSPIIHLHSELHKSPWGEFLYAIAKGEKYNLKWKRGYGIVVLLAVPPFPYAKKIKEVEFYGMDIHFHNIKEEDMDHVHFEDVAARSSQRSADLYISDTRGYVMYVTGVGKTIKDAQKNTYKTIDKIIIPKKIYRNDIGTRFMLEDMKKLKKWGYLQ
jgi:phosphoribosylamine---glycine ligase